MAETTPQRAPASRRRLDVNVAEQFEKISATVEERVEGISATVDRRLASSIIAFGFLIYMALIVLKVFPTVTLTTTEFITMAVLGTILCTLGTSIRIYEFRVMQEVSREAQLTGYRLLEKQIDAVDEQQQNHGDVVANLIDQVPKMDRRGPPA